MAKSVKKNMWKQVALLIGAAFAWSKLGIGTAASDVGFTAGAVTGVTAARADGSCPAGWVKVGDRCVRL